MPARKVERVLGRVALVAPSMKQCIAVSTGSPMRFRDYSHPISPLPRTPQLPSCGQRPQDRMASAGALAAMAALQPR